MVSLHTLVRPALLVTLAASLGGCPQFTAPDEPSSGGAPAAAAGEGEGERAAAPAPVAVRVPSPPPAPVRVPDNAPAPGAQPAGDHGPVEMIRARHILIQYAGSARAPAAVTRTKEEARTLATQVLEKTRRPGADFAAIANEYTDDQMGRGHGGDLPPFNRASGFVGPFVDAAYALTTNQISDLVETPFGFHIIQRLP